MELFSIGHSNHEVDAFVDLLQRHGVTAIADVRSHPYSRFLQHFNKSALQKLLAKEGIHYVFLGQELGARPANKSCYVQGKAVYEKIASTHAFNEGINRILQGLERYKISLMCAEKDPLTCHRAILVCQYLCCFNISIHHILSNGDLESHEHLEERMLAKHGLTTFLEADEMQLSLMPTGQLPTRAESLKKAYMLQGNEIAYVEKEHYSYA